jgi:hypothetical protein
VYTGVSGAASAQRAGPADNATRTVAAAIVPEIPVVVIPLSFMLFLHATYMSIYINVTENCGETK